MGGPNGARRTAETAKSWLISYAPDHGGLVACASRRIETMNLMSETSMMANRTVRVGIDVAPPAPMQLGNPDAGDFRGYEVDLLEESVGGSAFG